jgi:hypothetical protein
MSLRSGFLLVALAVGPSLRCPAAEPTISEQTARRLVEAALPALDEDPKFMQIVPHGVREFYSFSAMRGTKSVLHIYYLSVNPWTGDVWDAAACSRITTPELKKEQRAIWRQSSIPLKARKALQHRLPYECRPADDSSPKR